ncbi:non-ribosomal peptide synthetase [Amycolatopsis saalfeldensis]|uniref:Phosphopantetheine attachment site n=1 Tax=Amycolatopsis saalfeldensis TaxID=394193 RepID=A0A1H8YQC2_9PSEU|nr:non-ribosomal peptide synthetase [Amycolatopsis saalfeldensis]SEP53568.1 Phosphopantetheine attachment site [Amycolatopsis saalfeldensis]
MTTVTPLLTELAQAGVKLRLVGDDRLEVTAPRGQLADELRAAIMRQKAEIVEWLTAQRSDPEEPAELPVIVPDGDGLHQPFSPSDLQMSFLIGSREGLEYHVRPHQYMEMDFDDLDPVRFENALNRAIRRQRANLVVVRDDMMLQTVRDPSPVRVPVTDLRHLPDDEAQREIERVRAAMCRAELPLDRWPWLTMHVCLYAGGRARLHYNNNNFFTDAPATGGLLGTVLRLYHDPDLVLPELELSYRDCVTALAELEESALGRASRKYWCDRMADWPSAPNLPLAPGADSRGRSRLERREIVFPAEQWDAVKAAARKFGLTPTNVLCGIYAEVIAYWSGSRHFLLNNMMTHRLPLHPQIREVLGNFSSLYPLEVDWRHDEPFHERVRRLQNQVLADMQHVYWSGVKVLQTLNQVRKTPGRAVCPFAVGSALFVGQADRPVYSVLETPQVLLDCEFWEQRDGSLWVVWDVIEAMFPAGLMDGMLAGFNTALSLLAQGDSAWRQKAFDLLPASQRDQRDELNRPGSELTTVLLHDPLPRQAAAHGAKPAVITHDGALSYDALHRAANQLAVRLRAEGCRPGDMVAVMLPKGWQQAVAVFGALTAGGAYVPIDPAWPHDRIRYLIGDTKAVAVLTDVETGGALADLDIPVLTVEHPDEAPAGAEPGPAEREPGDLAYVIYTSGSTGKPKGAMLDHRGPANTIADINRRFGVGPGDVLFGISSLCFDLSVYDLFGAVVAGATLVLPSPAQTTPASWVGLVRAHEVTVWNSVPAIMQLAVDEAESSSLELPSLRTVLLSGDWIPVNLPERIKAVAPNAKVISLGGATEGSIWSICFPIERREPGWTSIPYGRPLANQSWHILDETGRDAPTWVPGHLHIGGAGVALGYFNDPERTGAAFVSHPRAGERLYRTGDLGRYLPSGDIEFLGRSDFQVKIQGFRVEPGEIEQALLDHRDVGRAVVVARDTASGKQLAAFVVGRDRAPAIPELRAFLAERLPAYMVPSYLTVLDHLPLTGNGKLDRRALETLEPAGQQGAGRRVEPRTATEEMLAAIWQEVLSVEAVGADDDFFELGGQSFAALRVVGLLTQRTGRRVPLGELLRRRTVAELATWLDSARDDWSPLVTLRQEAAGRPAFLVHPAGGNVLCYRRLTELVDRPVRAFQAPGPAVGRRPWEEIEGFADEYLQALLDVQPSGPYLLGGWSSGAVIAVELAHRLEQRGELVERLVVIDSPAPLASRSIDDMQTVLWFLEDLDVGFDPGLLTDARKRDLATLGDDDRLARVLDLARGSGFPDVEHTGLAETFAVFRGVVRACNRYRAPRINADVLVLRAQDGRVGEFADHPYADSPDWGWGSVSTGTVTAIAVPGTHHTLLSDPGVAGVAATIEDHLRRHRSGN